MPYLSLRPSQVLLDSQNPRLPDGTASDREAINRLLDDGPEQLINLARDMAKTGETNPAELPIAMRRGSKYIVLEGNRRFAALKLLNDQALADKEAHQQAFRRAAALGKPPRSIFTHVVSSREEADHWITLRHTGDNNGVGTKRWSAGQTATHRRRNKVAIDAGTKRSIVIADELARAYVNDVEMVSLVQEVRQSKLTNIGRLFSPDIMTAMHLTIHSDDDSGEGTLWARHSPQQLRDFFIWAFEFIRDRSVDAYKNAAIRSEALGRVNHLRPNMADAVEGFHRLSERRSWTTAETEQPEPADSVVPEEPPTDRHDAPAPPENSETTDQDDQGEDAEDEPDSNRGTRKYEARREKYLFQGLRLPNHRPRIQSLLKECRSVELDNSPGIACVMARVLVELSVSSDEVLARSGANESDPLRAKIIATIKYLDPDIENPRRADKTLDQAYMEAQDIGVRYLNGFVHNPNTRPDPHLALRFSQAFRPLLERVDREI